MLFDVKRKYVSRRRFLRASGIALALPWLDAMLPAFASRAEAASANTPPKRFLAIMYGLGFHGPNFFPKEASSNVASDYLKIIEQHRHDYTVLSGLSHAEQNGNNGHASSLTWLTGAKHPGLPGFRNTISLDQLLVEKLRPSTRFPSLTLGLGGERSLSWTAGGIQLPGEGSPAKLFQKLFVNGNSSEVKQQILDLKRGKSILDTVGTMAERFERGLGPLDQQKMQQYLTAVRELESGIQQAEGWADKPKPPVDMKLPRDIPDRWDIVAQTRLMHDLIVLAFQTDATRIIAYTAGGFNPVPTIPGVDTGWHDLSHHGQDTEKIEELSLIERTEFKEIDRFLTLLKTAKDATGPMLSHTTMLLGSNLGNASAHNWRDLPILLAGGGFKHGNHIIAGGPGLENARLGNLFVQIGRNMGVDLQQFGHSDATSVKGLE